MLTNIQTLSRKIADDRFFIYIENSKDEDNTTVIWCVNNDKMYKIYQIIINKTELYKQYKIFRENPNLFDTTVAELTAIKKIPAEENNQIKLEVEFKISTSIERLGFLLDRVKSQTISTDLKYKIDKIGYKQKENIWLEIEDKHDIYQFLEYNDTVKNGEVVSEYEVIQEDLLDAMVASRCSSCKQTVVKKDKCDKKVVNKNKMEQEKTIKKFAPKIDTITAVIDNLLNKLSENGYQLVSFYNININKFSTVCGDIYSSKARKDDRDVKRPSAAGGMNCAMNCNDRRTVAVITSGSGCEVCDEAATMCCNDNILVRLEYDTNVKYHYILSGQILYDLEKLGYTLDFITSCIFVYRKKM
ncbi:MAG: hypothetical protein Faunusvirus10_14 [Faunusvirus sp.]|jgi:hypothetical protein|uniref:Uncharacterized protein n=1 Tax=Faunusvirus sp. TaxID=2487766 RepID=A0A3G4ZZB8_9VIRU|nr:MAG: hypothetical protein Faunusvirus10_14 [Faunusvirus sp.]